jgi:hypothetical protein
MNTRQFIQWQDLFVLFDDGAIKYYEPIEAAMREQANQFPQGIVCLCVLPPDAKPPPDDIKRTVKNALARLAPSLTALAYVIEGTGFRGVAARAALVGMKILASRPYPIYVETTMQDAIAKVLPHLPVGRSITSDVTVIMRALADARAA